MCSSPQSLRGGLPASVLSIGTRLQEPAIGPGDRPIRIPALRHASGRTRVRAGPDPATAPEVTAMDAKGEQTAFVYTTYIQETPERVWQGLTDPALMKRYWRHQTAGPKTFHSDWKKGSTYEMAHDDVGLVVSGPDQVILESHPAPPAGLHLAHDHPPVGRGGRHGRGDRRSLA